MALDTVIEQNIGSFAGARGRRKAIEKVTDLDAYKARANTVDEFGNEWRSQEDMAFYVANKNETIAEATLEQAIEDKGGYDVAVRKELELSTEAAKGVFYGRMLKEGVLPGDASEKLQAVAGGMALDRKLQEYLKENNTRAILEIADEIVNSGAIDATLNNYFRREGNDNIRINMAVDAVKKQANQAYAILQKDGDLHKEIEKGIDEHKAYALAATELYKAKQIDTSAPANT